MSNCACQAENISLQRYRNLSFVFLELTATCNNKCPGCSNFFSAHRMPAQLMGQKWTEIIQRLSPYVNTFKLTGGEPTLHPEFGLIIKYLEQVNKHFLLLTNGRWFDFDYTLDLLAACAVLDHLFISLHGINAAMHEAFTNAQGSYDDAVRAIRGASEAGLDVATSMVFTRYNWNHVDEFVDLSLELGATGAVFHRYIGAALPDLEASPQQSISAFEAIEGLRARGYPVRFGSPVPQCVIANPTQGCKAGQAFVAIDPWGNVRPCALAPASARVGNLLEQSVEQVLASPQLQQWACGIPIECIDCPTLDACGGGCTADRLLRGRAWWYGYTVAQEREHLVSANA